VIAARWLDHLPPWMAWGAVASTGAYTGLEITGMAVPLLAAGYVEWRGASLLRFRRALELVALAVFLFNVLARTGILPTVLNTLFVLCAVRLCLPRELPQRRQLLLMGFLAFLTTAVATSEMDFLLWSLAWVAGSAVFLVQLNWEKSALLHSGPVHPPPFRQVPRWLAAVVIMGAGFFVVLPRLRMGMRGLPLAMQSLVGVHSGLSDVLDLSNKGPILGGGEVAMRIIPEGPRAGFENAFGFLKAMTLEDLEGQRWEKSPYTPRRATVGWARQRPLHADFSAEIYLSPNPMAVLPLPYGRAELEPPEGENLRAGPGASVRWNYPVRRILSFRVALQRLEAEPEPLPPGPRREYLTQPGSRTESALRWSQRVAPGDLPPRELASRLSRALQAFRYTLENPSGGAGNPLEDFLEHTRAGHCEFFASSLAIMLRHRGVPARVATGYRLGPWIEEGGYYLVTQNEAHSWVEFYDPEIRGWRVADPTPSSPPSAYSSHSFMAELARLADSARFRWDRSVVRFSDQDQVAGLEWAQAKADRIPAGLPRTALAALAAAGLLALLVRLGRAALPFLSSGAGRGPGRIPQLRPLLRAAAKEAPPLPGETARAWLKRLGGLRPARSAPMEALAREADAAAYGGKGSTALARMAREEAKAWKAHS